MESGQAGQLKGRLVTTVSEDGFRLTVLQIRDPARPGNEADIRIPICQCNETAALGCALRVLVSDTLADAVL